MLDVSHHPTSDVDDAKEGPNCSAHMDDVNDCEDAYGHVGDCSSPDMGSSPSNCQRKRETKMKFSGSRPKGRHRT